MNYTQVINIFDETGLSPEELAAYLHISNMTYRRWRRRDGREIVSDEYGRHIAGAIYQLLEEGKLDPQSERVNEFLTGNIPEFFQAVVGKLGFDEQSVPTGASQQDKISQVLARMGASTRIQGDIDRSHKKIGAFGRMGEEWKRRITGLITILKSKKLTTMDKWVAYGALFYLITPFDLIPDNIPVVGYIDDFGILGFALAYYAKVHSHLFQSENLS